LTTATGTGRRAGYPSFRGEPDRVGVLAVPKICRQNSCEAA